MIRTKLLMATLAATMILSSACSDAKAPGAWAALNTGTGDVFYSVNFVNENVGWLNGQTDRGYVPPEGNDNANKSANRKASGKKPEDAFKANQGFEVLQTTDGGQTWRQIPDQDRKSVV